MLDARRVHQLVPGRMELDLVDALAVAVVGAQHRRVCVRQPAPFERLAAGERRGPPDAFLRPSRALAPEAVLERGIGRERVVVDERGGWLAYAGRPCPCRQCTPDRRRARQPLAVDPARRSVALELRFGGRAAPGLADHVLPAVGVGVVGGQLDVADAALSPGRAAARLLRLRVRRGPASFVPLLAPPSILPRARLEVAGMIAPARRLRRSNRRPAPDGPGRRGRLPRFPSRRRRRGLLRPSLGDAAASGGARGVPRGARPVRRPAPPAPGGPRGRGRARGRPRTGRGRDRRPAGRARVHLRGDRIRRARRLGAHRSRGPAAGWSRPSVEHPAVAGTCRALTEAGYAVDTRRVDAEGRLDVDHFASLLRGPTTSCWPPSSTRTTRSEPSSRSPRRPCSPGNGASRCTRTPARPSAASGRRRRARRRPALALRRTSSAARPASARCTRAPASRCPFAMATTGSGGAVPAPRTFPASWRWRPPRGRRSPRWPTRPAGCGRSPRGSASDRGRRPRRTRARPRRPSEPRISSPGRCRRAYVLGKPELNQQIGAEINRLADAGFVKPDRRRALPARAGRRGAEGHRRAPSDRQGRARALGCGAALDPYGCSAAAPRWSSRPIASGSPPSASRIAPPGQYGCGGVTPCRSTGS